MSVSESNSVRWVELGPRLGRNAAYVFKVEIDSYTYINERFVMLNRTIPWCVEQFGPSQRDTPRNRRRWWYKQEGVIYLLNQNDAFAFKMRWL